MRKAFAALLVAISLVPSGASSHEDTDLVLAFAGEGREPPDSPKAEDGLAKVYEFVFTTIPAGRFEGLAVGGAYEDCRSRGEHHIRLVAGSTTFLFSGPFAGDFECTSGAGRLPASLTGTIGGAVLDNLVSFEGSLTDGDGTPHEVGCSAVLGPGYNRYGIFGVGTTNNFSLTGTCQIA